MIDYYKGIDTETGEKLPYLAELEGRLDPEKEALVLYAALAELSEELANRENMGEFSQVSQQLVDSLPAIKRLFTSADTKMIYDRQLTQAYQLKGIGTEILAGQDNTIQTAAIYPTMMATEPSSPRWSKWLLQGLILVLAVAMMVFLNIKISLMLIIMLVLAVLGLFLL